MFENPGAQSEDIKGRQGDIVAPHLKTTTSGILAGTQTGSAQNVLHVVTTRAGGGFDYYRCEPGSSVWRGPVASMGSPGNVHGPVLVEGKDSSLDAIFREVKENREVDSSKDQPGRLLHTYAYSTNVSDYPWKETRTTITAAESVVGTPCICRRNTLDYGLEVIAPLATGGLRHWSRPGTSYKDWKQLKDVETSTKFSGCAINMGPMNRLEVVAVDKAGNLWHIQRNTENQWSAKKIAQGVTGSPALVESARTGAAYDLVVPLSGGQIAHYTIDSSFQLGKATSFGLDSTYDEIGLIYSHTGKLEVVARRTTGILEHYVNFLDEKGWVQGTSFLPLPKPSQKGSWKVEFDTKVIGVHASVLHTGQVLLFGLDDEKENEARGALLDPKTGGVGILPGHMPHVFCGGHALLGNGDLLVAGGHTHHEKDLHIFGRDKQGQWHWYDRPMFKEGRWYPTCTTLPDGKVLIISGAKNAGQKNINNSY